MTTVALASVGVGLGVLGVFFAARRGSPRLRSRVLDLERKANRRDEAAITGRRFSLSSSGHAVGSWIESYPALFASLGSDLAITDLSLDVVGARLVTAAGVGALAPVLIWVAFTVAGSRPPVVVPLGASVLAASVAGSLVIVGLRRHARGLRRHARRAVGTFLDLVVLGLAGGMGVEGALQSAASVGDDPILLRLASAIEQARDRGEPPWVSLARLGETIGVGELVELSAAISLAGTEGARIRSTLSARAATIRRHELSETESEANAMTERLFLPGTLLLVGFLIFIGYPAFARIAGGL